MQLDNSLNWGALFCQGCSGIVVSILSNKNFDLFLKARVCSLFLVHIQIILRRFLGGIRISVINVITFSHSPQFSAQSPRAWGQCSRTLCPSSLDGSFRTRSKSSYSVLFYCVQMGTHFRPCICSIQWKVGVILLLDKQDGTHKNEQGREVWIFRCETFVRVFKLFQMKPGLAAPHIRQV